MHRGWTLTKAMKARLPYLYHQIDYGKSYWYMRRNGRKIRLKAPYGTPEFEAEYYDALKNIVPQKQGPAGGTLAWLIERYRETTAWQSLSNATRRQRENILRHVLAKVEGLSDPREHKGLVKVRQSKFA